MGKTKYRIIQMLDGDRFYVVQFKRSLLGAFANEQFGWQDLNTHGSLDAARRCMKHMVGKENSGRYKVIEYGEQEDNNYY